MPKRELSKRWQGSKVGFGGEPGPAAPNCFTYVLTSDGTGAIVVHKKLDAGKFELPKATRVDDQHVIVTMLSPR